MRIAEYLTRSGMGMGSHSQLDLKTELRLAEPEQGATFRTPHSEFRILSPFRIQTLGVCHCVDHSSCILGRNSGAVGRSHH